MVKETVDKQVEEAVLKQTKDLKDEIQSLREHIQRLEETIKSQSGTTNNRHTAPSSRLS